MKSAPKTGSSIPRGRRSVRPLLILTLFVATAMPFRAGFLPAQPAQAAASVTVTGVAADNSSVKIAYNPVPGARDYRVYDTANPTTLKYAGLTHLIAGNGCPSPWCGFHFVMQSDGVTPVYPYQVANGGTGGPQELSVPALSIEWNKIEDGKPHTLVVQAVNELGPVPPSSLYDRTNAALYPSMSSGMSMPDLGMNEGMTPDGNDSINGQGPYTDNPQVVAQSQPFVVQANSGYHPIPSTSSATQTFLDTFNDSEGSTLTQVARDDVNQYAKYTVNAGTPLSATITYFAADTINSFPMIESGHFMDVLFDGGPSDSSWSMHNSYGSMFYSPVQTASFANGQMLHLAMEVDGHVDPRRWMDFAITPANDPITSSREDQQFNMSDQGLFLQIKNAMCTLNIDTGPTSSTDSTPTGTAGGSQYGSLMWGPGGSSPLTCDRSQSLASTFSNNGIGLDNRSRFDFFLTQTHAAIFEDGVLVAQSSIPAGSFPWASGPVKVYFSHYTYHTDNDFNELRNQACYAENAYWYNDPVNGTPAGPGNWGDGTDACAINNPPGYGFEYSDERHWDNIGFEVLPASAVPANGNFSGLSSLIAMPAFQAPAFTSAGSNPTPTTASPSSTPAATATSTVPAATATSTGPASTPAPTATADPNDPQFGLTSIGSTPDSRDANDLTASRITTGSQSETVSSMSGYVGQVDSSPHNQYSLAIYGDASGSPGALVAQSGTGTLSPNSWNTLPISAFLQPNTSYWLVYNNNGSSGAVNNLYYNNVSTNLGAYSTTGQSFGGWPSSFGSSSLGGWQYSLYVTASSGIGPATTATPTNTPVPPTPAPTNTLLPPTAVPTNTFVPPTATPTKTAIPPTSTPTPTPRATSTPTTTPIFPTATAVPLSGLVLGNFENTTDGFIGNADVLSATPSTWAPAVAMGSYSLAVKYKIPAAGSEVQLQKTVNVNLSAYHSLSVSVYPMTPSAAGTGVKVRFLVQGSNDRWYASRYQPVPIGTRTTVGWNLGSIPRAPMKQIYVCWRYTTAATGASNQLYLDALAAS